MNYQKSLIKLTAWYMLIMLVVSGLLSFVLYRVATNPFERRLELGERVLERPPPAREFHPRFEPLAVREAKRRMAMFLIYFNLGVLCLAGVLSYLLARRELRPMAAALELQSRFTSDAAHELRTPLTAMKAEIEVALRGGDKSPGETRDLLESSLEEIGKLESLSASLLRLAHYESGESRADVTGVRLGAVAGEAIERVAHSASGKRISIGLQIEADCDVKGDRVSLVEMLVIFLDNSVKYSGPGTSVAVSLSKDRSHAVLQVRDQGYGIPGGELDRVFERFYRGSATTARGGIKGYGLGLSIAKRIADIHDATVSIGSVVGIGTTVTVRMPLARRA